MLSNIISEACHATMKIPSIKPLTQNIAIALLGILIGACSDKPAQQQIQQHIDDIRQAVKHRRADQVLEHIAANFRGSHQLDYLQLKRILLAQMLRHEKISVTLSPVVISLDPDNDHKATMKTTALVTGGGIHRLIPDDGRWYQLSGQWRKDGGQWRLTELEWQ